MTKPKPKLLRITTVPISLNILLKGQLAFMREAGFEVITCSADGPEVEEFTTREGVKHFVIPFTRKITPFQDLMCLMKLIRLIKKERPDIVHSHTPKAGLLGMMAAKFCGVRHRLHTVAGLPLMESKGTKKFILKITEVVTYRYATKVYPNSLNLKKFIEEKISYQKGKLTVIGKGSTNGVNLQHFQPGEKLTERGKKWIDENIPVQKPFVFTFIGRIVRDKGIHELVRAFEELKHGDACLVLVGPFEELDPIDSKIKNRIINNPLIITSGFQQDVRPFLAVTDLFVFPSYREGFPNVLLQAAAMNVAAIASNINGCNEIIDHGKTGWLVDAKNTGQLREAMEHLMTNDDLRRTISDKALIYVRENYDQQYLWSMILKEYKDLIHV